MRQRDEMKFELLMVDSGKDKEQGFCEVYDSGKKASESYTWTESIQCISLQRILKRFMGDAHSKAIIKKGPLGPRTYWDY